jgi:hypothetical protein
MSTATDRLAAQLERTTKRLAQVKARRLLQDMRRASASREKARRADFRRRLHLGQLVIDAGAGDWSDADIRTSLGQAALVSEHEGGQLRVGALSLAADDLPEDSQ